MHYLMGEKINVREIMRGMDFNSFKGEVKCSMYPRTHGGWAGKLRMATERVMAELELSKEPTQYAIDFINKYHTKKITTKQTNELINRMISPMARQQITKNGDVRAFLGQKATKTFMLNTLDMFFNYAKELYAVELDTSVTGDVRRLLRMPGGINLKQGYACHGNRQGTLRGHGPPVLCRRDDLWTRRGSGQGQQTRIHQRIPRFRFTARSSHTSNV